MRNKIAKKLKKYAFATTITNGWEKAKSADAVHMTNIRYFAAGTGREGQVQFCTRTREYNAPRRYYRRMKRLWASLTPEQKLAVYAAGEQGALTQVRNSLGGAQ